jgi:secreted PhoX family phosphatase
MILPCPSPTFPFPESSTYATTKGMHDTLSDLLQRRLTRRTFMGMAGVGIAASLIIPKLSWAALSPEDKTKSAVLVKDGQERIFIRWGDPLTAEALPFNPAETNPEKTRDQFGFNNDYIAFFPLGKKDALLAVNHEFPDPVLMHGQRGKASARARAHIEMLSVGISIFQIHQTEDGTWKIVRDSPYNRRINAMDTLCMMAGPAAGDARLITTADPTGKLVMGTLGNCGGGVTPWGTFLSGEENIDLFFRGKAAGSEAENHARFGLGDGKPMQHWAGADPRFNAAAEPNEPNRFGWVLEVNPKDIGAIPIKRTALGRMKHEYTTAVTGSSGRCVVYLSDDQAGECFYKFISTRPIDTDNPANNRDLLDDGLLYAAKFYDDGDVLWLPLIYGEGPLTADNGFASQADVLIDVRKAAKLLGATPMDRAEGIALHPKTEAVYIALTKNPKRTDPDPANPRAPNPWGHLIRIITDGHEALRDRWEIVILGTDKTNSEKNVGDPTIPHHPEAIPFANPDNLTFTPDGTLWVCTDGAPESAGVPDGLYTLKESEKQWVLEKIYRVPVGAEPCAPTWTPDQKTVFLSVQHPGRDSPAHAPSTRWPDFSPALPPRPAVVVLTLKRQG